ncbi:MAG: GTPase ObgE [Chloroflexi bacterium]|nr:GTPase ObgE [Chloroflexota bacterium]
MFRDEARIYVKGGDGGDGMVTFRREKYVPYGGPSGGDGGKGGDVVLVVNPKMNTLFQFERSRHFRAKPGVRGGSSNMTGANGDDLVIEVPPGTIVREDESDRLLADLTQSDQRFVVARGGRGGRGNARFKTSTNQAPRIAERGEPGRERWVKLELKLIADVGIVGVPNAGKSTLISVVSAAKPKIAAYPFTTLTPNLGVVLVDDRDMVVADIPGLVEGAHSGIGLGHSFLRHVQRTRLLIHMLDGTGEDPIADFHQIMMELTLYDEALADRPQIIVLNKMDMPQTQERWPIVQQALGDLGHPIVAISALTRQGTHNLMRLTLARLDELPELEPEEEIPVFTIDDDEDAFEIARGDDGSYRVLGTRIERAANMTYWEYHESIMRFQRILEALGISRALEDAGVQKGDIVYIGDYELEWGE